MTIGRGDYPSAVRADLAVAHILAQSDAEESLPSRLLAAIGDSLGWDFGGWWELGGLPRGRSDALHRDVALNRVAGR
jgi:hypothetical protein